MGHLFVTDGGGGDGFQCVDPRVTYSVGELFLLSPGHGFGQELGKGFADDFLFDGVAGTHLGRRVQAHGHVEEFLVKEGYAAFDTPGRQTLVGPQAVVEVELGELADGLFVEGLRRGSLVEIEVTAEHLVCSFTAEHHLDPHRLDDAGQQIHRRGGAHGGDVVGFDVIDDVADGVQSFLNGVVDFVVHRTDVFGHQPRFLQIGGALQAHGEGVELRPPGGLLSVGFDAAVGIELGYGRDDRRVQTAGEQHAVGHVAHQLAVYGLFEGRADG